VVSGCTGRFQPDQYTGSTNTATAEPTPTPEISFPFIPENSVQPAFVTKIVDGDTGWVRMDGKSYKVRYIGMNTPEIGDAGADEATALNSSLVMGKEVQLYKDVSETDKYGRLLRFVVVDGKFANYELVKQGVADPRIRKLDTACDDFLH
jgi:micrococcal nuclease